MSDDPLDHALAAYTETRSAPRTDAAATRQRVLRSVAVAERRRSMRRWSALAVLVLASNATTWAFSSGRVERALAGWEVSAGETAGVAPEADAPDARAIEGVAPEADATVDAPDARTVEVVGTSEASGEPERAIVAPMSAETVEAGTVASAPAPTAGSVRPARVPRSGRPTPTSARATPDTAAIRAPVPAEPAVDNADRVAFEAAHHAHFHGADDDAALMAWDDYLARFPQGRFVPEALFNRAICLLRVGRAADARPALERLAAGVYGTAHQDDARALLERLPE